jgi:UDP-N-acetylmuramate--alanine ligase
VYCPTLERTAEQVRRILCPGDLFLTVGAGDIYRVGEKLLEKE